MRLCIYGAGAIGGYLAAELVSSGAGEITLIARGPHLEAMQRQGLTLLSGDERRVVPVRAIEDPQEAGPQDFVILALKAHSVSLVTGRMAPLLADHTAVVTAQNGIPWWYFHRLEGPWQDRRVESVDPDGRISEIIGPQRAIGCVVYPACEIEEPGVVRHLHGNRFMLGEPDGSKSERIVRLSKALTAAGLKAPVRRRIRDDIWLKLWGNLALNPVSALTLADLAQITSDRPMRAVVRTMMVEAQQVAESLGVKFPVDVDRRIQWAADVGAHKTSMLQDLENGRPLEIAAVVTAVAELGDMVGIDTPTLDAVLGLVGLRARIAGLG